MLRASLYRRVFAISLAAAALVALGVGFFAEVYFRSNLQSERARVFQDVESRLDLLDLLLKKTQVAMLEGGSAALRALSRDYPDPAALARLGQADLAALARRHGASELYVIDGANRVVATSFSVDQGLDLGAINPGFTAFLNGLRGRGIVVDQHLTVSSQTGEVNTYQYLGPLGSDYLLEVSSRLDDHFPVVEAGIGYEDFVRLLFRPVLPSDDEAPVSFDIITHIGTTGWSIIEPGVRRNIDPAILDRAYAQGEYSYRKDNYNYYYRPLAWGTSGAGFGDRTVAEVRVDVSPLDRFTAATILTGLVSCALAALFALGAARSFFDSSFVSRIESLHDAIRRVASGERGVTFDSKGEDELSVIGKSVAAMLEEVKAAEEGLRNAKAAEAVGVMAGGLAHDVNNLLAGAVGAASLLRVRLEEDGSVSPEDLRSTLSLIESTGARGDLLVRDLLALARADRHPSVPVDLCRLVRETAAMVKGSAPASVSVEVDLAVDAAYARGSPEDLGRVVLNLCRNGVQAMTDMVPPERKRGGVLKIGLASLGPDRSAWAISVADGGVGMGPETQARLFTPFFSTKSRRGGSGLGLAASRAMAEAHGGRITVASVEGSGSVFTLVLPAAPPPP